jgi:glycosyltransferase involved in cell wall biosynthesis
LKNLGVRGFLIQTRIEIRSLTRNQPALEKTDGSKLNYELFPGPIPAGAACPFPAIGVLILQHDGAGEIQPEQVLRWTETQTLAESVNSVVWDRASGSAAALDGSDLHWDAPNIQALAEKIESRYVCIASEDLLCQEPTYLETNLLALESESLAFTVNLRGKDWQTSPHLASDKPPGHNSLPLHRLVVRKDCIADDLSIDLSPWQKSRADLPEYSRDISERHPPVTAGEILVHTTNKVDDDNTPPFEAPSARDLTLFDRHLLANVTEMPGQVIRSQMLLPPHKVIPALSEPGDLPTVFMVMPFLAVGGAEKIALKVMGELVDRIRFVVLAFDDLDPALGTTADQFRRITPYVYMIPDFLNTKLNGSFMEYLIARFDPLTIYIANGAPWIYDTLSTLKHSHPSIRIVDQVYDSEVGWINRYDAALITYLDGHIGSNPKICQAYIEKGARPEQVYYIENGTDPAELNPGDYDDVRMKNLKVKLGLPLNTKVVTFASRLNPQKRPLDFIELARRFSSDTGVTFLMVGDGPLAQTVEEQVQKIGLKNIVRHPFYQPISDILATSDVLVLPSEFEGMPMIVIETLTMGKPVVATDVGNVREIIARTNGGIVVSQIGDISALSAGVRKMLDAAPPLHEIRQAALAHFDWKVCAEKHLPAFFGTKNA